MSCLTVTSACRNARLGSLAVARLPVPDVIALLLTVLRTIGAPSSSALKGSTTTGKGSYSTSTASTPSAAIYRSVASTAATSWPGT